MPVLVALAAPEFTTGSTAQSVPAKPKCADARRDSETVLVTAHEALAEGGESSSFKAIARRAGVGIGTLYREFPNRQALLEALYLGEVEEVSRSAAAFAEAQPWAALEAWFARLIGYLRTKRAVAAELLNYLDADAPLFQVCRASLYKAGEPLLAHAQQAGVARRDVTISQVSQMVAGIPKPGRWSRPDRAHHADPVRRPAPPPRRLTTSRLHPGCIRPLPQSLHAR